LLREKHQDASGVASNPFGNEQIINDHGVILETCKKKHGERFASPSGRRRFYLKVHTGENYVWIGSKQGNP